MVDIQSEEYKLGQNIRKYRLAKGWSQMDLSNAVDIDRTDISKYEKEVCGDLRTICHETAGETGAGAGVRSKAGSGLIYRRG